SGRQRMGGGQLGDARRVLEPELQRGEVDAVRRERTHRVLWHGEARACAANRTCASALSIVMRISVAVAAVAVLAATQAHAELSAEELTKLAQNPVGNLISARRPASARPIRRASS